MMSKELEKEGKHLQLASYWSLLGVVVDPEWIMLSTRGIIKFRYEEDCKGCQIEGICPCKDNPYNNDYEKVLEKLKWLQE